MPRPPESPGQVGSCVIENAGGGMGSSVFVLLLILCLQPGFFPFLFPLIHAAL